MKKSIVVLLAGTAAVIFALVSSCSDSGAGPGGGRPTTPDNLKAEALSMTSITLTWSSASGAESYNVFRSDVQGGGSGYLNVRNTSDTIFIDSALIAGTTYHYMVSALNQRGEESARSASVSATTIDCPIPAVPTNVMAAAEALSATRIRITWDSIPAAESYDIYHSTASGDFALLGNTENRTFTHEGLSPATTHQYRVVAKNLCGESERSSAAEATTNACPPPEAPANLTAAGVANVPDRINISWDEVATALSYNILRSTSQTGTFTIIGNTLGRTNTSYTDNGLEPTTTYFYRVTALSDCAESERSNFATAATGCDIAPAVAPGNVRAEVVSDSTIMISWDAVPGGGVNYAVYISENQSENYRRWGGNISHTSTLLLSTSLSPATTYYFRVTTINACGESERSASFASITTDDCDMDIPPDPTELTATALSSRSIEITWNSVDGAAHYDVFRSTERYSTYWTVGRNITGTSFIDTTTAHSTTYFYAVKSINACGGSEDGLGNVVSATTMCETSIPTNITATAASSSRIDIAWAAIPGAVYYEVYRATSQTGPFTLINNGSDGRVTTNSASDVGLSSMTTYFYRITAKTALCDVSRMSEETVHATTQ